jgi:hypothetical protein
MTTKWASINSRTEQRLYELVRFYVREGRKCRTIKAHLASCTMFGSALETVLILMVSCHADEIPIDVLPKKQKKPKRLLDWSLHDLLVVARTCNWLPAGLDLDDDWDDKRARVGDYAMVVKMVRNLVHPARILEDLPKGRVSRKHSRVTAEIYEAAVDHLETKIHASLAQDIKRQSQKRPA